MIANSFIHRSIFFSSVGSTAKHCSECGLRRAWTCCGNTHLKAKCSNLSNANIQDRLSLEFEIGKVIESSAKKRPKFHYLGTARVYVQQEQDIKHPHRQVADTRLLGDLKKVEQALRSAEMNVRIAAENLRQIKSFSQSEKIAERLRSFMQIQQQEARKKEKKLEMQQASKAREKYRQAKVLKLQSENFVRAAQKE
jgi:hypothetical protein